MRVFLTQTASSTSNSNSTNVTSNSNNDPPNESKKSTTHSNTTTATTTTTSSKKRKSRSTSPAVKRSSSSSALTSVSASAEGSGINSGINQFHPRKKHLKSEAEQQGAIDTVPIATSSTASNTNTNNNTKSFGSKRIYTAVNRHTSHSNTMGLHHPNLQTKKNQTSISNHKNNNNSSSSSSQPSHSTTASSSSSSVKFRRRRYSDPTTTGDDHDDDEDNYNDNTSTNTRYLCSPERDNVQQQEQEDAKESESSCNSDFQDVLKKTKGLELVEMKGDGNCLFRAISLQVLGDVESHLDVRKRCLDFMEKNEEHYSKFVNEPYASYISRKRLDGVHGNNPEIQAMSELYNRPIQVYIPEQGSQPINTFQTDYKTTDVPIRLSYHDGNHYNAVIDPLIPTAGLGLGLPNLEPGLADRLQLQQAVQDSEAAQLDQLAQESQQLEFERVLKESKQTAWSSSGVDWNKQKALALSDVDAGFELEQAALLKSMESWRDAEGGRKLPSNHGRPWKSGGVGSAAYRDRRNSTRSTSPAVDDLAAAIAASLETPTTATSWREEASSATSSSHRASLPTPLASAARTKEMEEPIPEYLLKQSSGEYPQTVQELVMNGFELPKVLRAYELIGDNFDDLLAFLISSNT